MFVRQGLGGVGCGLSARGHLVFVQQGVGGGWYEVYIVKGLKGMGGWVVGDLMGRFFYFFKNLMRIRIVKFYFTYKIQSFKINNFRILKL